MARFDRAKRIREFVGSAHLFNSALADILHNKLLRELAGDQLSPSQLRLLELLARTKTQTVGNVAAFLRVSYPAASKTVDKLVQRKWLSRTEGETDRRAAHLSLTSAARKLVADYDARRRHTLAKLFRRFSPGDLDRLTACMEQVAASMVSRASAGDGCVRCVHRHSECLGQGAKAAFRSNSRRVPARSDRRPSQDFAGSYATPGLVALSKRKERTGFIIDSLSAINKRRMP
ncbi:MAG TPA: MarR family transcriptional regulator [Terriglobales bacterium]|jgi:DNA-binding MarR family transcriptional regulator|nr:MarR family transcriptional regulator [Terriglobales bacterium]